MLVLTLRSGPVDYKPTLTRNGISATLRSDVPGTGDVYQEMLACESRNGNGYNCMKEERKAVPRMKSELGIKEL